MMSAKAEELARQLLEKTEGGKLKWQFVPDTDRDIYKFDAEDGITFSIKRRSWGADQVITFELTESDRVVLADAENNFPLSTPAPTILEPVDAFLEKHNNTEKIKRFRLYSDLFYAAQDRSVGGDKAIEKAQEFLARLA